MPYYVEEEDEQGRRRFKAVPTERERLVSRLILALAFAMAIAVLWMMWPTFRY